VETVFVETVATGQSVVMTHVTAAGISVAVLQWLKNSKYFPWITAEKGKLLRVLAVITSAIGAVGIGYTWHPDARQLIFNIPTLAGIFAMFAAWAKSFVMQEIVYQTAAKNPVADLIRELQSQGILPTPPGNSVLAAGKIFSPTTGGVPIGGGPIIPTSKCEGTLSPGGIDRRKIFPAMAVCLALFAGAIVLLCSGCAVRHNANGTTSPATRFEQLMAWNTALAQTNDGFVDNVISLQQAGTISKDSAHVILYKQGEIAQADKRITENLKAAALCGTQSAGTGATPTQLSDASGACAKTYKEALDRDFTLVVNALAALNSQKLLGLSDPERAAIGTTLTTLQNFVHDIVGLLQEYGASAGVRPTVAQ
jgi:hypothetical protein